MSKHSTPLRAIPGGFMVHKRTVSAIRNPTALAIYIYICSDLRRPGLRQFESVVDHFGLTVDQVDSAYSELSILGLVGNE